MNLVILVLVLSVSCSFASQEAMEQEWIQYKALHNKAYLTSSEEYARFNIWKTHSNLVVSHNKQADAGLKSFWLKMNQFGDLTNKEFVNVFNGFNASLKTQDLKASVFKFNPQLQVPATQDWRTQGYVTPVKDQGQCGSCWSFSATGSLEGQHFKASGSLVSLSEQNLVDCSTSQGNMGCNGGLMDQAFTYVKVNKGIDTEASYPYTATDGSCRFSASDVGATDAGFTDIEAGSESALMQAVGTVGPVSVAIDASHTSFQLYSHGIYYEPTCSSTRLDHGVLAVGYGSNGAKQDYWIVKNSWNTVWGDKGYINMARNRNNNCGIASSASYPLV